MATPESAAASSASTPQSPTLPTVTGTTPGMTSVFEPSSSTSPQPPADLPDSFFDHTVSDVQAYHASVTSRSKGLNDAPLLTAKHRDAAVAEAQKKKADKWPTTTIRVKFSDGTQIQREFPSSSPIQPVYAFVRESLAPSVSSGFTLYQPPRTMYPENPPPPPAVTKAHPNPAMKARIVSPAGYNPRGIPSSMLGGTGGSESLSALGLVPQSVLLIKWDDAALNASGTPAPLSDELRARAAPLPPPTAKPAPEPEKKLTGSAGDVKMPKWLQKGLLKKK